MNPKSVIKLRENIPELRELIAFLASEASKENNLDGIDELPADERAIEATVRVRTYKRLLAILAPLIDPVDSGVAPNPAEYVV